MNKPWIHSVTLLVATLVLAFGTANPWVGGIAILASASVSALRDLYAFKMRQEDVGTTQQLNELRMRISSLETTLALSGRNR